MPWPMPRVQVMALAKVHAMVYARRCRAQLRRRAAKGSLRAACPGWAPSHERRASTAARAACPGAPGEEEFDKANAANASAAGDGGNATGANASSAEAGEGAPPSPPATKFTGSARSLD